MVHPIWVFLVFEGRVTIGTFWNCRNIFWNWRSNQNSSHRKPPLCHRWTTTKYAIVEQQQRTSANIEIQNNSIHNWIFPIRNWLPPLQIRSIRRHIRVGRPGMTSPWVYNRESWFVSRKVFRFHILAKGLSVIYGRVKRTCSRGKIGISPHCATPRAGENRLRPRSQGGGVFHLLVTACNGGFARLTAPKPLALTRFDIFSRSPDNHRLNFLFQDEEMRPSDLIFIRSLLFQVLSKYRPI